MMEILNINLQEETGNHPVLPSVLDFSPHCYLLFVCAAPLCLDSHCAEVRMKEGDHIKSIHVRFNDDVPHQSRACSL